MNSFKFSDYVQRNRTWCESDLSEKNEQYHSRNEAEIACNKNPKCKAFYDAQSKNDSFILCGGSVTKPSNFEMSALFVKCTFLPFKFRMNLVII